MVLPRTWFVHETVADLEPPITRGRRHTSSADVDAAIQREARTNRPRV